MGGAFYYFRDSAKVPLTISRITALPFSTSSGPSEMAPTTAVSAATVAFADRGNLVCEARRPGVRAD